MPIDKATAETAPPKRVNVASEKQRKRSLWAFADLGRRAGLGASSTIYGSD